jgi:protein-(glutamine-N5) methyltransferase, release factor-specific
MIVKEASNLIAKELKPLYPASEIDSFIYLILNHLLGFKRFDISFKSDVALPDHLELQIYDIIEQLKQKKPIQYIFGSTEFFGLPFDVDESVLIPRPETEELVQWILEDCKHTSPEIIDVGTGSGCIPIALAKNLPKAHVSGVDISETALATAKRNSAKNQVMVDFFILDILIGNLSELPNFDIIVSNPPYVTPDQKALMDANVVDFEPHLALFVPQNDPLVFYKAIAKFASNHLKPNGSLYFEINEDFFRETEQAVIQQDFSTELKKDINGKYRMLKASKL